MDTKNKIKKSLHTLAIGTAATVGVVLVKDPFSKNPSPAEASTRVSWRTRCSAPRCSSSCLG